MKSLVTRILEASAGHGIEIHRVRFLLMDLISSVLRRHPLLSVPSDLKQLLNVWVKTSQENYAEACNPAPEGQERGQVRFAVLDNTQFVEKVLFPVSALTPDFLFFKILMSESVTAEKFKEEITKVMKTCQRNEERARELTGRDWTGNAKIVVFIDELNTSNILGVIKEVFMDRTLDGKPLKDNIFFVGAINPAEHHTTPKSASSSSFSSSSSTVDVLTANRCIQVLLPKVDSQDLVALATGLLYGDVAAKERVSKSTQRTLGALIRGGLRCLRLGQPVCRHKAGPV